MDEDKGIGRVIAIGRESTPGPETTSPTFHEVGCSCGEDDCDYLAFGYPWCRSCGEHHRPPECPVDEQGRSLDPQGKPWADLYPPESV